MAFPFRSRTPQRFSASALIIVSVLAIVSAARAVVPWTLSINTNFVVNITNFGAIGDGVFTNTAAISNAISAAAAGGTTNGLSGGTVEFPAGTFLSGPFSLKSSVNLLLDTNAVLRMLPFGQYPASWFTNNVTNVYFTAGNFISASSLHDIEISGYGAIDGQGLPWWPWANTNNAVRPIMIRLSGCNRELIQNVTLSNSPEFHISISGSAGNSTVQGVIIRANPSSDPVNPGHNTDACDVSGTNILVQNCDISVGDDNFTCGGKTSDVLITNNTYGYGHGVSIGSFTSPYVSNMTVINCTFNNTDQGIRIKSDRDRGGLVHDIRYYNLSMTNVMHPILIYCQYTNTTSAYRAVDSISPSIAASYPSAPVTSNTPMYRDIIISNVTGTAQNTRAAGLIWGLPEAPMTNITLIKVSLTGSNTFGIYDATNVSLIDCSVAVHSGINQFSFYNTQVTFSNSTPSANLFTLDGLTTNSIANSFSFYNVQAALKNTNALASGTPVTLSASTFTISNNLVLSSSNAVNFTLGTNAANMAVVGNLGTGGTDNFDAGAGFTNGTYTLFTYTGTRSGTLPIIGMTPPGYVCAFDTNTPGQVKLVATLPPGTPAGLTAVASNLLISLNWFASPNSTGYILKRSTTNGGPYQLLSRLAATNYIDAAVNPGKIYYYVVSATNSVAESANSLQSGAAPLPSAAPVTFGFQLNAGEMQLSWPADHLGWRLEAQTNNVSSGLGPNWANVPGANLTNQIFIPLDPANGSVFLRLVYP